MNVSILEGKRVLAVDDEPDILEVLEDTILDAAPECNVDKATSYNEAVALIESNPYDLVILDIMGVRGFELLDLAVKRDFKVVMLTAHALTPEALKRSYERKARAYVPKERLKDIIPFLEDALKYDYETGWTRLFKNLQGFFSRAFESDWEKKTGMNWREWGR